MKALLAGWFSFEQMGATAGDLLVRDRVAAWLEEAGCPYDLALAPPFGEAIRWESANATDYTHLVFVCGPFGNGPICARASHGTGRTRTSRVRYGDTETGRRDPG